MQRIQRPGYSFTLSATGDTKRANFFLTIFKELEGGEFERVMVRDSTVQLDGEEAGPVEYVRDALMAIVESF